MWEKEERWEYSFSNLLCFICATSRRRLLRLLSHFVLSLRNGHHHHTRNIYISIIAYIKNFIDE